MSRMKKKWLRGGISLALVAALSLSVVTPVWAAEDDPVPATSGKISDKSGEVSKTDKDVSAYGNTYENTLNEEGKSLLTVNNQFEYTVTIPKQITLNNYKDSSVKEIINPIAIKECDLAPNQTLEVTVNNVKLYHALSGGTYNKSAEHTINASFESKSQTGKDGTLKAKAVLLGKASANASYVINATEGPLGSDGATNHSTDGDLTLKLQSTENIHAGTWYGSLNFTVYTNQVSAKPTGLTDTQISNAITGVTPTSTTP